MILRRSIRDLDKALDDEENRKILSSTRTVIDNCKKYRPKLLDRMRQHIAIRAFPAHLTAGQIIKAMGGAPVKDAYFFRLSARFMEFTQGFVTSVRLWDEFRKHAVQEGWFGAESLESASLYLHMAELICRCPKEEIESEREFYEADFEDYDFLYGGQPALDRQAIDHGDSDDYFLYPDALFERANQIDPDPEIFKQWLDWQRDTDDTWKATDRIALAWHEAFPRDTRPLLFLMESAEKRNALKKAMGYIEKAESIDALNPAVRKARLRLLISTIQRHLKQKKPHLVEKDFEQIDALPQSKEGDRPSYIMAFALDSG